MTRLLFTFTTMAVLTGGGMLYARLTRPLLHPASSAPTVFHTVDPPVPSPEFESMAEQFLTAEPWAANAPYRHRDDNTFVYCQQYMIANNDRTVHFQPFAIVFADSYGRGKAKRPITMVAKDGAQIDFSSGFKDGDFEVGRITSGRLMGWVRIEGPDNLLIIGRTFHIDEANRRIWSDDIVRFRYGPHRGRGRGVEITLSSDDPERGLSAENVRSVRLGQDVVMEMLTEGEERTEQTRPEDLMTVSSRGALEFDLETNIARMERRVVVQRPTVDGQDRLQCDVLSVRFSREDSTKGKLRPVELTAEDNIELQSHKNQLLATNVTNLTYLLPKRRIHLANTLSFPDGSGPPIRVIQSGGSISCREMIILNDEDNRPVQIVCRGPGRFTNEDEADPSRNVVAFWKRGLTMQQQDDGLQLLTLAGSAIIAQPHEKAKFGGDSVRLWFRRNAVAGAKDRFRPVKLIAENNVRIESPGMMGPIRRRLTLNFVDSAVRTDSATPAKEPDRDSDRSGRLFDEAYGVAADTLTARVRLDPAQGESAMPAVTLTGGVIVQSLDSREDPSVALRGDFLQVLEERAGAQTMKLTGKPASVRRDGRRIVGSGIYLDRGGNEAEVDGRGELRLEVSRDLDGQELAKPAPLVISWSRGMHFDGRVADLTGEVRAVLGNDVEQRQELHCRRMKIGFSRAISFTKSLADGGDAGVGRLLDRIECVENVRVHSFRFEHGRIVEERHAQLRNLTIEQTTQTMHSTGGGWITSWDRGSQPALSQAVSARANTSIEARKAGWNYTRIDFGGRFDGDFRKRTTTFTRGVNIIYGPVERLSQVIDPERTADGELPRDAAGLSCERLKVTERRNGGLRTLELLGTGNAKLEARLYSAVADEIKFDEQKNVFTLLALGEGLARMWRREHVGADWSEGTFRRFVFNPRRDKLKLNISGASGVSTRSP